MEFKNSQSFRCLKSICLWSLLSDLILIVCFFAGYILTCIAGLLITSDFAQGFGWVALVLPVILLKLLFILCFAVANGYFLFILYSEYKIRTQNLPLAIIEKTEQIFDTFIKSNLLKRITLCLAILSFVFNIFILIVNIYIILVIFITFVILLFLTDKS